MSPSPLRKSLKKLAPQELDTSHWGVRTTRLRRPPHALFVKSASASTAPRPNVSDDGQRPLSRDGMARNKQVICPRGKQKYCCKRGWTGQIRLNRLDKFDFARTSVAVAFAVLRRNRRRAVRTIRKLMRRKSSVPAQAEVQRIGLHRNFVIVIFHAELVLGGGDFVMTLYVRLNAPCSRIAFRTHHQMVPKVQIGWRRDSKSSRS